ncbi:13483_t:CDS:1, partial [Cetraspora pellucida]
MDTSTKKRICYPVLFYFYGPGGSRKTGFVRELFNNNLYIKPQNSASNIDYWTDYKGQDVVLLDEYTKKINWFTLLKLLNDNSSEVEIEPNKFVSFNANYIFMINTKKPSETYSYQFLERHLTYIIEFTGKWNSDIEKRTTDIIFHKGDEEKFHNMKWDIEYIKENINDINTVKIQNQKIDGKI